MTLELFFKTSCMWLPPQGSPPPAATATKPAIRAYSMDKNCQYTREKQPSGFRRSRHFDRLIAAATVNSWNLGAHRAEVSRELAAVMDRVAVHKPNINDCGAMEDSSKSGQSGHVGASQRG